MGQELCSWCGVGVARDEGFRAAETAGERRAVFCRLEHIVPWTIQGAHWETGSGGAGEPVGDPARGRCARCGADVGDAAVLLVRHRGAYRIADAFCGVEHLREWAKAGGRWAEPGSSQSDPPAWPTPPARPPARARALPRPSRR